MVRSHAVFRRFLPLVGALTLAGLAGAHEAPDYDGIWTSRVVDDFDVGESHNTRLDGQGKLCLGVGGSTGFYLPAGTYTSAFFKAPRPFDVVTVGFGADLPSDASAVVQVRALGGADGSKSRWITADLETDVAFPTSFEYLQYRVRLQTHDPEATPRFEFFTASFGMSKSGPEAAETEGSGTGDVAKPDVISRADWGARPPRKNYSRHVPRYLVVHHSSIPDLSQYKGAETIRGIQRFHQDTRGWIDIGYHFLIGPEGEIFQGRPETVSGAHVAGKNRHKVGVMVMGNYQGGHDELPAKARAALVKLLAWLGGTYGIDPSNRISGHRDWMSTDCPGSDLWGELTAIRRDVKNALTGGEGWTD